MQQQESIEEHSRHIEDICNKYIGCYMELDNSNNEAWEAPQCIGGGLGVNGDVLIASDEEIKDLCNGSVGMKR